MSILVELAEQADVSVEGVLRVLTREPVSDAVKERVLAVLDDLTPEQTRAVQRFALAALYDVLPRPDERVRAELPAETGGEERPLPAAPSEAVLVELKSVLGELAEAVRDLKHETGAERRERVDDLAVMIDLITTGWQRLDGRLGRLERQLGRLESGPPAPLSLSPQRHEPAHAVVPVEEPAAPPVEQRAMGADRARSGRVPLAAAVLAGGVLGGIAMLQLLAGDSSAERLVSARAGSTAPASAPARSAPETTRAGTTASQGATTRPRPPATTAPATTSSVLGTTVRQKPKPAPTATAPPNAPAPRSTPAPPTTAPPVKTTAAPPGFQPTRNWAWAPVPNADYYVVEFLRSGKSFYRASPKASRITLPDSVVFTPGSYQWVVRPGFGAPAAKKLGAPVVDSPFQVGA